MKKEELNREENPYYETEVIKVDGEEHTVRKRDDYTVGTAIAAASIWVSIIHA